MSSIEAALFLQRYTARLRKRAEQISLISEEDSKIHAAIVRHAGRLESVRDELLLGMEENHNAKILCGD